MPFTAEHKPQEYVPSPPVSLEGGEKAYLDRELQSLRLTLASIGRAIEEIQDHLESLP